jgi:hypothetical protein
MADTPNTAPTGAPIPDAQAGTSAVQLDQSQVQPTPNAMEEDQSQKGPVASPDGKIPPVQQNVDVTTNNSQQMPTENADTSNLGLKPDDPKNKMQQTPAYQTPSQHPAVQKASLLNEIATTLAGGPRYSTTIDPNTGTVTRTKVPLSTKQLGMAIALEALSGAITGAAQHGPNHVEAAAAAGYQQGQQESQQVQQANQANEDQAKNDYATKAMIAHTNFQTYQNAVTLGKLEYDANHEQDVAHAPMIDALRNQGGLLDEGLRGNVADLAKKYNVGQDLFIRQNTVPRLDPNTGQQAKDPETGRLLWDGEYALIDPKAKISVPDETLKYLADHHVQGFYKVGEDGKTAPINLPNNTQMRAVVAANAMAAASAIQVGDHAMTGQLAQLGKDGDKYVAEFHKNYEDAHNTVDPSAMKVFSRYAAVPLDQLQATMIKDKVDPDTRGQIMSLIPTGAIEQSKLDAADKQADQKAAAAKRNEVPKTVAEANSILSDPTSSAIQKSTAQGVIQRDHAEKANNAYSEGAARYAGEAAAKTKLGVPLTGSGNGSIGDLVKDPKLAQIQTDPNEPPVGGIRKGYLAALTAASPNLAAELKEVYDGHMTMSDYALAKGDGQLFGSYLARAYPGYDQSKAKGYTKLRDSFVAGEDKNQIEAGNTTMQHAAEFYKNAVSSAASIPGTHEYNRLNADAPQLVEELNSAYTKGVLHEDKRKQLEEGLTSSLPYRRVDAIKEYMQLLSSKTGQKNQAWQRGKPSGATYDFPILSDDARAAYQTVTGQAIGADGVLIPQGAVGTAQDTNGNTFYVDAQHKPLGRAPRLSDPNDFGK